MRIGFMLSSLGGSPLQAGLHRGFTELGHAVHYVDRPGLGWECDLLVVFNQSAHDTRYVYPEFPEKHAPICFIDNAEFGYFTRLPDRVFRYANTFAPGSMQHDTKNPTEQLRLMTWLSGKSFPYFLREFSNLVSYPTCYHPIDYPLYEASVTKLRPSRAHYLSRPLDLFCSWGASHPWRRNITEALRAHKCESIVRVLEDGKVERIRQPEYFRQTENAKCSVSFDGYGSGSFRMTEVLVRTVLLQGPLSIRTRAALVDGETCVAYNVVSDGETFISTNVGEKLAWILANPDQAYQIYERGYHHCLTHLTETATARYVLEMVEKHDWNQRTPLLLT